MVIILDLNILPYFSVKKYLQEIFLSAETKVTSFCHLTGF